MEEANDKTAVIAEEIVNLTEVADGEDLVWVSVGENNRVLVLTSERMAEPEPAVISDAKTRAAYERWANRPTRFRFIESYNGATRTMATIISVRRFIAAAAFPGNAFLVRMAPFHDRRDEYVHLVDRSCIVRGSFRVGRRFLPEITSSGRMWATYGDQAAYAEGGIVCLDPEGRPLLKWNDELDALGVPEVFDCYAANVVSDEESWFWYLDHDFTLVRMAEFKVDRYWQNLPIRSSFAFAVDGDRVLFHGGRHGPDGTRESAPEDGRTHFHLVDLERMDYREFFPVNAAGKPLLPEKAFGRGPKLYFQDSGVLYAVDASKLSM